MTPFGRTVRLSAAFLGSNLARAALAFGLSLALGRGLGAERFGRWILCTTWASTLTVVSDLGFGVLLTRDGARPDAEAGRLLSGALILRLALAVPLGVMLYFCAGRLASDAESIGGLRVAALLGVVGAAYGCFGALLRSQPQWLPTVLGIETGWLAVQLAGLWWLVSIGSDWSGWSGGSGGSGGLGWSGGSGGAGWAGWAGGAGGGIVPLLMFATAVQLAQIATAAALWRRVFGDRGRLHLFDVALRGRSAKELVKKHDVQRRTRRTRRKTLSIFLCGFRGFCVVRDFFAQDERRVEGLLAMLRRALPFAASGFVANLQTRVAPLMLGDLSTQAELGLFAAASRVGRVARLAPQAMFAGALPVLSHEWGRDRAGAHRAFRTLDRALLALAVASAAGCMLVAAPLVGLIYGPSFAKAAPALVWVGLGLIPALSNSGRKTFLYAAGGEALVVRWSTVGLLVQVASAAALIPMLGSTGAAVSVLLSEAAIWLPLRRALPQGDMNAEAADFPVVSGFSRTV